MGLKPKSSNNNGPSVDWERINGTLEEDTYDARLAYVIDLGLQQRGKIAADRDEDDCTFVAGEEEALELLTELRETIGEYLVEYKNYDEWEDVEVAKNNLERIKRDVPDVKEGDEVLRFKFRIVALKDANEAAYIADLVDHYVEYVEGQEEKQFRVTLNPRDFVSGMLSGFALTNVPPKGNNTEWTFSPLSMHAKLAKATYTDLLAEDNDVSYMLDKPFGIQVSKNNKGFPKFTPAAIRKKDLGRVEQLDCTPMCITFEEATLEQIQELKPNKQLVDKIKVALDYKGSAMEKALEAYAETFDKKPKKQESEEEEVNFEETPVEEQEKKLKKVVRKAAKKPVEQPEEEDDEGDDEPPW